MSRTYRQTISDAMAAAIKAAAPLLSVQEFTLLALNAALTPQAPTPAPVAPSAPQPQPQPDSEMLGFD